MHFFLLAARGGDVAAHDGEVLEARWMPIEEAETLLAFKSERQILRSARELIAAHSDGLE